MVEKPTVGGFVIWLLLGLVTGGIYTSWWIFSRLEVVYRAAASSKESRFPFQLLKAPSTGGRSNRAGPPGRPQRAGGRAGSDTPDDGTCSPQRPGLWRSRSI